MPCRMWSISWYGPCSFHCSLPRRTRSVLGMVIRELAENLKKRRRRGRSRVVVFVINSDALSAWLEQSKTHTAKRAY